jgi:hypothetical protein
MKVRDTFAFAVSMRFVPCPLLLIVVFRIAAVVWRATHNGAGVIGES